MSAHTSAGKTVCAEWVSIRLKYCLCAVLKISSLDLSVFPSARRYAIALALREKQRVIFTSPSKLWAIRSTERCTKSSRMWVWWPVMSPLTLRLPAWLWPPRWDCGPLSAGTSTTGSLVIYCFVGVFSFRFWGVCCTEGQRLWGRWRGSSLMRSITWETQVGCI